MAVALTAPYRHSHTREVLTVLLSDADASAHQQQPQQEPSLKNRLQRLLPTLIDLRHSNSEL